MIYERTDLYKSVTLDSDNYKQVYSPFKKGDFIVHTWYGGEKRWIIRVEGTENEFRTDFWDNYEVFAKYGLDAADNFNVESTFGAYNNGTFDECVRFANEYEIELLKSEIRKYEGNYTKDVEKVVIIDRVIKDFVVKKNAPKSTDKLSFYNELVRFYTNYNDNERIDNDVVMKNATFVINEYQHSRFPIFKNENGLRTFNKNSIKRLTPSGNWRKKNFFNALVAFMDCALIPYSATNDNHCEESE